MTRQEMPEICDYEGSTYRTDFWEGKGRTYEDGAERAALRRLLPEHGQRILELGAGFGRISDEYRMYRQVVLLDYSFSQLQYARERLGDERFIYVAADAYQLPFAAGVFDGATMIRVIHHFADVPAVLAGIRRVLAPGGVFILEHANKRNLKALLRYALRRQQWSPYDRAPVEFVKLNFDFHPAYIGDALTAAGFSVQQRVPVSFFRLGLLKRALPAGMLVRADSLLQRTPLYVSPSIFVRAVAGGEFAGNAAVALDDREALFAAPGSGAVLRREGDSLVCTQSGLRWAVRDGIYDFKQPIT